MTEPFWNRHDLESALDAVCHDLEIQLAPHEADAAVKELTAVGATLNALATDAQLDKSALKTLVDNEIDGRLRVALHGTGISPLQQERLIHTLKGKISHDPKLGLEEWWP